MSAKDLFHNAVRHALEKDGWSITHDPFRMSVDEIDVEIDLGAEQVIAAEKQNQKIAVEVKSFLSSSPLYEFHQAFGQYLVYYHVLRRGDPGRVLFLALPQDIYDTFFRREFIQNIIRQYQLNIIVFETRREEVIQWIK